MLRVTGTASAFVFASLHFAMAAPPGSPAQTADLQQAAEKSCNDSLDRDRFDYGSMEECVADRTAKMERDRKRDAHVVDAGRPTRPN